MTHEGTDLALLEAKQLPAQVTASPDEVVEAATQKARALKKIVEDCNLSVKIGHGEHIRVEAWETLAAMNGCSLTQIGEAVPREDGAWTVRAGLRRMRDGILLAEAEHECGGDDDGVWAKRSNYAKKSMALTRAIGKVCRMNFAWVVVLAGYKPTPAEEMPVVGDEPPHPAGEPKDDGPVLPFGKEKGKPVSAVDTDYLKWLATAFWKSYQNPAKAEYKDDNLAWSLRCIKEIASRLSEAQLCDSIAKNQDKPDGTIEAEARNIFQLEVDRRISEETDTGTDSRQGEIPL